MTNTEQVLPPPVVAALLPDSADWDETNLLPAGAAVRDLPVEIPEWEYIPIPSTKTLLTLYWRTGISTHVIEEREFKSEDYPVIPPDSRVFEVPTLYLVQGIHDVWYQLTTTNGETSESEKKAITIDLTPPLTAVIERLKFDTTTVTEQYLTDHGQQLVAEVPVYQDCKPGDVITWYWNTNPLNVQPGDEVDSRLLLRGETQPLSVEYPGSMIIASGDGERYAFYTLRDRAGNVSAFSQPALLQVSAQPVPRVLPAPRITETSGSSSSTLNPYDALKGAHVEIPDAAVIYPGETVCVQWGEPGTVGAYRTEPAESALFTIPSTHIAQHFDKSIPVYYEVFESGVELPHVSRVHTLSVSKIEGFPVVQCDKVTGGQLSLGGIATGGKASFTLARWSFMGPDQFVSIEVRGTDNAGALVVVPVVTEYPVPGEATTIAVGHIFKADLQRFKIGGLLEVRVRVSFDAKLTWQRFPSLTPTLYP